MSCADCLKTLSSERKSVIYRMWEAELNSMPYEVYETIQRIKLRKWSDNGIVSIALPAEEVQWLHKKLIPFLAVA